jgi:hypothetical protein
MSFGAAQGIDKSTCLIEQRKWEPPHRGRHDGSEPARLPRRFRSSARSVPAVRVGLPSGQPRRAMDDLMEWLAGSVGSGANANCFLAPKQVTQNMPTRFVAQWLSQALAVRRNGTNKTNAQILSHVRRV